MVIFAEYVPLGYYDMVLEQATSINSIFDMMSTSMQLTSENQYILNSHKIKYGDVQDDNSEKLYLRPRFHYALAAPKAGSKFDGRDIEEDVEINELSELMLVEKTFVLKGSSGIRWTQWLQILTRRRKSQVPDKLSVVSQGVAMSPRR